MKAAFTLVEILVTVAIVALLVALLFPALTTVRNTARNAACVEDLHSTGAVVLLAAADNNGQAVPAYDGTTTWITALYNRGYLRTYDTISCPGVPPYKYRNSSGYTLQAYGLRRWSAPDPQPANGPSAILAQAAHPASFVLLADSSMVQTVGKFTAQMYFITHPGDGVHCVNFRHNGKANVCFLDGSVRGITPLELTNLNDGWLPRAIDASPYP